MYSTRTKYRRNARDLLIAACVYGLERIGRICQKHYADVIQKFACEGHSRIDSLKNHIPNLVRANLAQKVHKLPAMSNHFFKTNILGCETTRFESFAETEF